jgi:hypothetical protein
MDINAGRRQETSATASNQALHTNKLLLQETSTGARARRHRLVYLPRMLQQQRDKLCIAENYA